jgi:hypothetical protein
MNSNDDDQPTRREKQGGSDKKQPNVTLAQVKIAIKEALQPVELAIKGLTSEHAKLVGGVEQLHADSDRNAALLKDDGALMTTLASVAQASADTAERTKDLPAKLDLLRRGVDEIPEVERRVAAAVDAASSKGEAAQAQADITSKMVEISGQVELKSEERHQVLVGRFDSVDQGITAVRTDISSLATDLVSRISGLSDAVGQVLRENRKIKRRTHDLRKLIGSDGELTRTNFGTAFSLQADYLEGVVDASSASLAELIAAVKDDVAQLPANMSKELVGVLSQLLGVAQKVLQGATSITQHMEGLSRSTDLAFNTQSRMLTQIEAQATQAGIRMEMGLQDRISKTADALENRLGKVFEDFDPENILGDLKENYDTLRTMMSQYARLVDEAEAFTGKLSDAQVKVIDQSEKAVNKIANPMASILEMLGKIGEKFSVIQSGFESSKDSGEALVNRIQRVSFEAYQNDLVRVSEEAAKQQQRNAEALFEAVIDRIEQKLPNMVEEIFSKAMGNIIAGVALDDAEPTK